MPAYYIGEHIVSDFTLFDAYLAKRDADDRTLRRPLSYKGGFTRNFGGALEAQSGGNHRDWRMGGDRSGCGRDRSYPWRVAHRCRQLAPCLSDQRSAVCSCDRAGVPVGTLPEAVPPLTYQYLTIVLAI
jgi:hypothetical protein